MSEKKQENYESYIHEFYEKVLKIQVGELCGKKINFGFLLVFFVIVFIFIKGIVTGSIFHVLDFLMGTVPLILIALLLFWVANKEEKKD